MYKIIPERDLLEQAMQASSPEEIGHLIRSARRRAGLTQKQLAAASGVGVRFLIELEKGKPTCEIGKTLTVMKMLGIKLSAQGRVVESISGESMHD